MGESCSKPGKPDTTNQCSDALNEIYDGKNFCTLTGSHNDKRRNYCSALGDNEWTLQGEGSTCNYDSCDEITKVSSGCCNGCCGITGRGVRCKRVAFTGDPLLCCLRDKACNPSSTDEFCFTDSSKQHTCDPGLRDQSSRDCQFVLHDFCVGTGVDSQTFINRWLGDVNVDGQTYNRPCYHAIYRNLYKDQAGACLGIPGVGYPHAFGYVWVQNLLDAVFERYIQEGGNLDARPGDEGNIQLNSMLWDICFDEPGLCEKALFRYCTNVTTETLVRRVGLQSWCGCYMQPEQYFKYTNLYQISKECTPACNVEGIIRVPSDNGVGIKKCRQSLCIIDQVTIDIIQSKVGSTGGITFNQLCSGCANGTTCSCILSDLTLTIVDSEIGNIDISQNCGSNAACYDEVEDENGIITTHRVPCTESPDNPFDEIEKETEANRQNAIARRNWLVILLFFLLILMVIGLWLYYRPYNPSEDPTIVRIPPVISSQHYDTTSLLPTVPNVESLTVPVK